MKSSLISTASGQFMLQAKMLICDLKSFPFFSPHIIWINTVKFKAIFKFGNGMNGE